MYIAERSQNALKACQFGFEWRGGRVGISGFGEDITSNLSRTLALDVVPFEPTDAIDIAVSIANEPLSVCVNGQVQSVETLDAQLIHVATVAAALLVDRCQTQNLLHAAGWITHSGATLVSGPPYAGKSNLSYLAWTQGYTLLGDDWLIYAPDCAEVLPVPKPIKPRVRPEDLPAILARSRGQPHAYGSFRNEQRLMIRREQGFYNRWETPVAIDKFVFLQKQPGTPTRIAPINSKEALPLLLAQTLIYASANGLQAVKFAKALIREQIPIYLLIMDEVDYDAALDLALKAPGKTG